MELSKYCMEVASENRGRYLEKISIIDCDPYLIKFEDCITDLNSFPRIMYPDIVNYLVYSKSAYSLEEMRAYKSLEAYNQAACGWVKRLSVKSFGENVVVLGKVMHSQRLSEKILTPWLICKRDGIILCAHCDCVAGLGEVCTHIGAVLFAIEKEMSRLDVVTATGRKAYWMPPSNKAADAERVESIDFGVPKKRFHKDDSSLVSKKTKPHSSTPPISELEKKQLLENLFQTGQGSVLHCIKRPFADKLKEELERDTKFMIMSYYRKEFEKKTLEELQEIGESLDLSLTTEECKKIANETITQSKSKKWYMYRAGRITASRFKSCCRTDIKKPAKSVIKTVCYPGIYKFKARALDYGCQHEREAIKRFEKVMQLQHPSFNVERSGFFINPSYPYFGASPDGLGECECCGLCIVEVKYPFCARFSGVMDQIDSKNFSLKLSENKIILEEGHTYYYQVQMQMAITNLKKMFLVVWSPQNFVFIDVNFNEDFWKRESEKAKHFFYKVVLPEALGKFYTRDEIVTENVLITEWDDLRTPVDLYQEEVQTTENILSMSSTSKSMSSKSFESERILYCICRKEDDGTTPMIACGSVNCNIEWYHMKCVGLQSVPNTNWICENCR